MQDGVELVAGGGGGCGGHNSLWIGLNGEYSNEVCGVGPSSSYTKGVPL